MQLLAQAQVASPLYSQERSQRSVDGQGIPESGHSRNPASSPIGLSVAVVA